MNNTYYFGNLMRKRDYARTRQSVQQRILDKHAARSPKEKRHFSICHHKFKWLKSRAALKKSDAARFRREDLCASKKTRSAHPRITMEVILAHPKTYWDWDVLSMHQNITLADLIAHPKLPWNWQDFCAMNRNITIAQIIAEQKNSKCDFYMSYLSYNPCIKLADVLAHPQIAWSWSYFSLNRSICIADVLARPDLPWDYYYLSENANISAANIIANPQLPWNMSMLPLKNDFTIEMAIAYKDRVEWSLVSKSPNITVGVINKHRRLPWDWRGIACNPNLTESFIEINMRKLDFEAVCRNNLDCHDVVFERATKKLIHKRRKELLPHIEQALPQIISRAVMRYIDFH